MKKLIRWIRQQYYLIFPTYKRLELKFCGWEEANNLMKNNALKNEGEKWLLAIPEEDNNHVLGMVYIERRIRIYE